MIGSEYHGYTLWWIFPLLMIILYICVCVFMMIRRIGSMMSLSGSSVKDT